MLRWLSLWMALKEMVEDMQQGQNMLLVAASLGVPNITDNHVPNFFAAVLLGQKVLSECCCTISGRCSCSAMASTSSSVKPHNPMQSSSVIIRDQFRSKLARAAIISGADEHDCQIFPSQVHRRK